MNMKTIFIAATLSFGLSLPALAQDVRWDMANEYNENSTHGIGQLVFSETLSETTDGAIEITNHFGGSIGYKSREHFDAVADGALPIANTSMGQVAGIEPLFLLSSLPFLVKDAEEARLLWEVGKPYYEDVFAANNQVLLYASPWTPAGIWANAPETSLEDIAGLKIRTWDASGTRTLQEAGAAPIQLSWADVVPQLATGGIDAVMTSADGGASAKFWEQLSHFSAINYSMSLNMTHINKDAWDGLSDEQRDAVLVAAEAASDAAWAALDTRVTENYAEMTSNGMTIIEDVPAEFLDALNEAGQSVYTDWLDKVGPVGQEILDEYAARRGS
ncbi:TRAP transporter substrate-binding protein [Rhodobacteraceae bacterium]|nr:TRAP transporter substrate-binding protein [Paracoccaceae bacterium]